MNKVQIKHDLIKQEQDKKNNNLIEIVDKSGVETAVEKILLQNISLLPNNIMTDRIKTSAGFYIVNRKDLMNMNGNQKLEMLYGILKESMLGGEAGIDYDIVPFKGKPTICRKNTGWFKIIDLIKPAEIVRFINNVVTTGDIFEFNPATEEMKHQLVGERWQDFDNIQGAYAYIKFANGFEKTVYLSREDLIKLKETSPSGKSEFSPWNSNSIRMVKAKIVKELAKELFLLFSGRINGTLARAIESDETSVKTIDEQGNIINDDSIYEETQEIVEVTETKSISLEDL